MIEEILWIFLGAAGLLLIAWCMFGLLLLPVFGPRMLTLCYVQDGGDMLEQKVRAYGWLRESKIAGGTLVIVDCGLSAAGLELALKLRERYDWVDYCPRQALIDYIELTEAQRRD